MITHKNLHLEMRLAEDLPNLQVKKVIRIDRLEYYRIIRSHTGTRDILFSGIAVRCIGFQ
jgi:hypothetical protein